jgi:DNA-binding response OmpR family regulator
MADTAKVLVVEDDPFLQKVYQSKLKDTSYQCDFASDGEEGLAKIKSFQPKVVLLDLVMPKLDGFGVLAAVQADASLAGINILVLTNLSQPEDKEKCLKLGAKEYMVKSDVSIQEILAMIQKYAQ